LKINSLHINQIDHEVAKKSMNHTYMWNLPWTRYFYCWNILDKFPEKHQDIPYHLINLAQIYQIVRQGMRTWSTNSSKTKQKTQLASPSIKNSPSNHNSSSIDLTKNCHPTENLYLRRNQSFLYPTKGITYIRLCWSR